MHSADDSDAVTFAGEMLDPYRHVCAFIDGADDDAVFDSFAREGLELDDRLIYLVDPARAGEPVTRLRHLGYDTGALLEQHRCEVRTWTDTYLRGGAFDDQAMLRLLEQLLLSRSSPRIRMLCDMGWASGMREAAGALIEFEAKANFIHAKHPHAVICWYDTSRFDGSFIVDVLRTHPFVLIGGILQENPFFVPPADFLAERARAAN